MSADRTFSNSALPAPASLLSSASLSNNRRERNVKFGIFDHVDRSDLPLDEFYEQRLRITELYDRLGFHGYHVAEHHFTPLGLAASPSVYLTNLRLNFGG